jgi:hypothetical protein
MVYKIKNMKHLKKYRIFENINTEEISWSLSDWWIPVEEQLPKDGEVVIVYFGNQNTRSKISIVRFEKGISKQEREDLKESNPERFRTYKSSDEDGNNKRPYIWKNLGPGSYFGQEATHWMPLPGTPDGLGD